MSIEANNEQPPVQREETLRLKRLVKVTIKYGRDTVEAVERHCATGSPSAAEIAVSTGVSATQVYKWIKDVRAGGEQDSGHVCFEPGRRRPKDARRLLRSERKLNAIRSRYGDEVADAVANFRGGKHSLSSIGRMAGVSREAVRQWIQVALCVESTRDLPDMGKKDPLEKHREMFPVLNVLRDWGVTVERKKMSKRTFVTGEGVSFCVRELCSICRTASHCLLERGGRCTIRRPFRPPRKVRPWGCGVRRAPLKMGQAITESGLSRKTLRKYCKDGTLEATKLPGRRGDWLIDADSLEELVRPKSMKSSRAKALEIARGLGI